MTNLTTMNFVEYISSSTPTLVDFWAPWCGPCRMLGPVVEDVAAKYEGKLQVGKVNVDEEMPLAAQFNISSIPALLLFKDGKLVDTAIGYMPGPQVEAFVSKAL